MSLSLKPPRPEDADALLVFERANRAYFEHWINARPPAFYAPDGVRASIDAAMAERELGAAYQYLIWQGGEIAGRINLRGVERQYFHKAELGYRVGQAHAGKGVASQALAALCGLAFGELGWARQAGGDGAAGERGFLEGVGAQWLSRVRQGGGQHVAAWRVA